jgi:hypothetical protein
MSALQSYILSRISTVKKYRSREKMALNLIIYQTPLKNLITKLFWMKCNIFIRIDN